MTVEKVGPYTILKAIGAGGTARIDLARIDRAYNFQRHVVVKRPLEHLRTDPAVAKSLQREAKIGGQLRHPNLVAVLDAGEHDGYDYLILEYVHGSSLRALMQTDDPNIVRALPLAAALSIVVDTARGMHAAHELADERHQSLGLVHRDVSPGNVLVGHDGTVKLADFGIAKETHVSTLSGSLQGTVTYMAPEQCRGHAFDRRADVFSLGVILYELVTQRRLFLAENDVASLHRVLSGAIPPPRQLVPSLPSALEAIAMHALAMDVTARIATAKELADRLESFAASEGLVLGARRIERLVDEQIGAKQAPWIKSTTEVDMPPVGIAEPSLVQVIAAVPAEPVLASPTFDDELPAVRALEQWVPAQVAPPQRMHTVAPVAPPRSRRRMMIVIMACAAAIGVGVALLIVPAKDKPRVETPAMIVTPTVVADPTPPPSPPAAPAVVTEAPAEVAPAPIAPPIAHHRPAPPKKPVVPAVAASPATGSGSSSPHVEWRPSLMLPTDSGSGHAGTRH